jgi:hypothetical protein
VEELGEPHCYLVSVLFQSVGEGERWNGRERVVQGSRGRDVSNRLHEEAGGDVIMGRVARWPLIYFYFSHQSYLSCGVLNVMNLDTIST